MKVGDLVTLKDTRENQQSHVKGYLGKVGKVIDKQQMTNKKSFCRVLFSGGFQYEDVGDWRIEKFLPFK